MDPIMFVLFAQHMTFDEQQRRQTAAPRTRRPARRWRGRAHSLPATGDGGSRAPHASAGR